MSVDAGLLSILLPALAAGLLVTATHVPLGTQVLARGIVFIDLAIAQIAGCGVILADRIGFDAGQVRRGAGRRTRSRARRRIAADVDRTPLARRAGGDHRRRVRARRNRRRAAALAATFTAASICAICSSARSSGSSRDSS